MRKLRAGILGANGAAGLEFVRALENHPWFEIADMYAGKNAGKTLGNGCALDLCEISEETKGKTLLSLDKIDYNADFICSALPSEVAKEVEGGCASHIPVLSTTSAYRYEDNIPILITEVNPDHRELLSHQAERGWSGWIAPGPNCTTVGLVMALYPIYKKVGLKSVTMTSSQAVSGGGYELVQKWRNQRTREIPEPFVHDEPLDEPECMLDGNVLGYIKNEEGKVKKETLKILGTYNTGMIVPAQFKIDCICTRVPTLVGHFENVFFETYDKCTPEDAKKIYTDFNASCKKEFGNLPSSPEKTIIVLARSPQPRYDAFLQGGMATVIGRIENCDLYRNGLKMQVLSNNTLKGAALGSIQVAEYIFKACH